MNILHSFTETVVTTPTDTFPISFEYDEKYDAVHVFLNDVAVGDLGYTVSQVNAVTLKVEPAIPEGTVRIERETDIDKMKYIFDAGALFIDQNVDADFRQIVHSQQEVRDGFIKLRGDVLPLVHGLQEALQQAQVASEAAQDASDAAQEAADAAELAAAQTQYYLRYFNPEVVYPKNARIMLDNGDVVQSTIANNTNNPNSDMSGWALANGIFVVKTVSELVDKNLKDGDLVKTIGYHDISDGGGAVYLISSTSTDYSIPLSNGLHAIFKDSFDIRKFGIRNSKTLDQSVEIKRMIAYADSRFYEIDFLGFSIMNPEIYYFTTSRGSVVKGLGFHNLHKLKNLHISNNKTKTLVQGTSCLLYMPKEKQSGLLELDNVTFDPYNSDYALNYTTPAGEYDGMMLGFIALPHPDWTDFDYAEKLDIDIKFKNIKFESPAVSYNISTAGLFVNSVSADTASGQYLGLYLFSLANKVQCKNINGILRDDIPLGTRVLVKNMIHDEAELGVSAPVLDGYEIKDCHSVKFSDNTPATTFKHHSVGNPVFNKAYFENCTGIVELYSLPDKTTKFKNVEFSGCRENFYTILNTNIDELIFKDSASDAVLFDNLSTHKVKKISGYSSTINNLSAPWSGSVANSVDKIYLQDSEISSEFGLYSNNGFHVENIELVNIRQTNNILLNGSFGNLVVSGYRIDTISGTYGNCISLNKPSGGSVNCVVSGLITTNTRQAGTYMFVGTTATLNVDLVFSRMQSAPNYSGNVVLTKNFTVPS